jgi:hypothetical protein
MENHNICGTFSCLRNECSLVGGEVNDYEVSLRSPRPTK